MSVSRDRNFTPMINQYLRIKEKYRDSLLLFRLGDFYELFFEDAEIASRILGIALTTRDKGKENPVPMCGVPYHAVDGYIAKLLKAGFKVAICEQVEDPKKAKGIVRREVTRVLTPSTAVELEEEEPGERNFLATIYKNRQGFAIAYLETSTGEIVVDTAADLEELLDSLLLIHPKEIIASEKLKLRGVKDFPVEIKPLIFPDSPPREYTGNTPVDIAIHAAVNFVEEIRKSPLNYLQEIRFLRREKRLVLDSTSIRNLEILRNLRDGSKYGSLISIIDKTKTSMGSRTLQSWITRPSADIREINSRLEAVEELVKESIKRDQLRELLSKLGDLQRIASRASLKVASPRDLAALRYYLKVLPDLKKLLSEFEADLFKSIVSSFDTLEDIEELLQKALTDEPPALLAQGGVIREGYHSELDELRRLASSAKSVIAEMEEKERRRTGISNLRIRYNKVFGYYIEVTKANLHLVPDDYIRKQTLVNSERFITPQLKKLEEKILHAEERIKEIEEELFSRIREEIGKQASRIIKTASAIGIIDALASFAEVASLLNYSRPSLHQGFHLKIVKGRHPVVEVLKKDEPFVPNDTFLDEKKRILIITGPNMGGKSTYLRQVALISILAHAGSFVPAEEAEIPVMDRIFTRIGASDFLVGGESTFMVEMKETSEILQRATEKSLIVLDEIGRGTSTFDGMSIAWAVVEYIHERIGAKTLFATHYHELTRLENLYPYVKNLHIQVREWQGEVIFLYELAEGASDRSYGIHVAKLAGIPKEVTERAWEVLEELERRGRRVERIGRKKPVQPSLFDAWMDDSYEKVKEILNSVDINKITPLEALNLLARLKEISEKPQKSY